MVSSGGSAAHCVLTGIRPGAEPNGSFVVMAIAAAKPVHLAPSITSVINTVPTPESWARGSMGIGPTPAIVDPPSRNFVPTMRPCCSAATKKKPWWVSRSERSPAAVSPRGSREGSWCRCNGPERLEANPPCLLGIVCPASPGPSRPAVHVESRVAGNQEEVPFAPVPRWPPELEGQRDDHGDRDHDPNRAYTLAIGIVL